jgi:predicted MFS family arabinose efflux permease
MVDTFRAGVSAIRVRPLLLTLILITFFFAAQSESYDRLWTAHLLDNFTLPGFGQVSEVVWFGILRLSALAVAFFLIRGVRRRINTEDAPAVARGLTVVTVLLIVLFIVFANAQSVWLALFCVLLIGPLRELLSPLRLTLINRGLEPSVRATVISMDGQTDAIGQISGGPILGIVGRELGVRIAMSLGALLLIPAVPLGLRTIGLSRKLPPIEPQQEVEMID